MGKRSFQLSLTVLETSMLTRIKKTWQRLIRGSNGNPARQGSVEFFDSGTANVVELDIPPSDPLLTFLASEGGPVELSDLDFDSPAVQRLKQAKVKILVPLINQGELIGLMSLGPLRSEQE